jgi:mono/diheme cytochrome c family protein
MRFPLLPLGLLLMCSACSRGDAALPEPYRDLSVPAQRISSAAARRAGRHLYLEHCAICHGRNANGRGPRHAYLSGDPANFTSREWRRSMTPRRVYYIVREGVDGTSMPSWKSLTPAQCWDLTAYVLSVSEEGP